MRMLYVAITVTLTASGATSAGEPAAVADRLPTSSRWYTVTPANFSSAFLGAPAMYYSSSLSLTFKDASSEVAVDPKAVTTPRRFILQQTSFSFPADTKPDDPNPDGDWQSQIYGGYCMPVKATVSEVEFEAVITQYIALNVKRVKGKEAVSSADYSKPPFRYRFSVSCEKDLATTTQIQLNMPFHKELSLSDFNIWGENKAKRQRGETVTLKTSKVEDKAFRSDNTLVPEVKRVAKSIVKILGAGVANDLAQDPDPSKSALLKKLAKVARDGLIESALKDTFPDLKPAEIRAAKRVISLYLDKELTLNKFAKETAKEEALAALRKEAPSLASAGAIADFLVELHNTANKR